MWALRRTMPPQLDLTLLQTSLSLHDSPIQTFFFCLFKAALKAYGSSQAKG